VLASWDAEASAEEKAATDALIARIQELQNTDGAELSGVQIIAHFLRIGIQPLQAPKNPMWMYSGAEDSERVSAEVPLKDLEKLVRHFTSLRKNHEVPSSCRAEPFSGGHALSEVSNFLRVVFMTFDHLFLFRVLITLFFLIVLFSCRNTRFFTLSLLCLNMVKWMSEPFTKNCGFL
jgi:hypothetical protein